VDEERHLLDTITDGDVRRGVLRGIGLDAPASELLAIKAETPHRQPVTAPNDTSSGELLETMRKCSVRQVPLLNTEKQVVDIAILGDLLPQQPASVQAVVMAGGLGTRLRPLTEDLPKPMLPVGGRPLMESIVEQLEQSGIRHINVMTCYKPEKIKEHFGDGSDFGVELSYVNESQPLGTAGALGLMERPKEPFLVINGDILTQVNFRALLAYHRELKAEMTVGVRHYEVPVPYGVVECEGPNVKQLTEKPKLNFFVNAGIYLLEPVVYEHIPSGERFDMTDLIQRLLDAGRPVVSFPIVEYWLDIGRHADYERAHEDVKEGRTGGE